MKLKTWFFKGAEKTKETTPCPICGSIYTMHIQDIYGQRTHKKYPQRFCMDCQSFFHHSGYQESEEQQKSDFEALLSYQDVHRSESPLVYRRMVIPNQAAILDP